MKFEYEAIFCIVNSGYSDEVMESARKLGARGGTVIHARGTANQAAEKLFEITVHPDKEIVMILVPSSIKNDILHALYRDVGLETAGQGIAFSLPVADAVGLTSPEAIKKATEAKKANSETEKAEAENPEAEGKKGEEK